MKLTKQFRFSLLFKAGVTLILLAFLLAALPTIPAQAYTGGYGLNFDGDDELLRADYYGILGPEPQCRNTVSISVWVRPLGASQSAPDPGSLPAIFTNVPNWVGIARGQLGMGGGVDRIWIWQVDQSPAYSLVGIPYTVGEWVHITLVHANGRLRGYKNGVLVGDVAAGTMGGSTCGRVGIGAYYFGDQGTPPNPITNEFVGQIDEVAIFQAELTEAEIREYMYREIDASHPKWANIGLYYKMSNGSGTVVTDNATGSYPGQIYGAVDWVTSAAHAGPRTSLQFDGTDEYVSAPDSASLDHTQTVSFEAWVNPADWNNNANTPLLVKGDASGTPEVNYYFGKSSTNQMMFSYYSDGSRVDVVDTSGASYSNGTWYHLAYTVDVPNNRVRFYRNGLLLSEVSHAFGSLLTTNNRQLTLARFLSSGDAAFQGTMDEVRLWGSVRSLEQIRENMYQTLKGDESGLDLYYRFDQYNDATQSVAYDLTGDQLNGTLQNMEPASDWVTTNVFNTWVGTDSTSWTGAGNWSQGVVPDATTNVGVYSYTGGNNAVITGTVSVANMAVGSGGSLSVTSSGSLAVSGNLFNNGALQQTQSVSGDGDVGFFNTGNYGGVLLDPNTDDLGLTSVTIRGNIDCTNAPSDTVRRCFTISPASNNNTIGKTITFFFDDSEESGNACDSLNAYHYQGGAWVPLTLDTSYDGDGRLCGANPRSVRVQDVTTFSQFVLNQNQPTVIELVSFSGTTGSRRAVLLGVLAVSLALLGGFMWARRRQRIG